MNRQPHLSRARILFSQQMQADGRAELTIRSYHRELELLTHSLGDLPVDDVTPHHLSGYLTSTRVRSRRDGRLKQVATQNRVKSVLRSFFQWCERMGLVERSPARHLRLAATGLPTTRWMTRKEAARFLRTIRRSAHPLARRDHALFAILIYTGVRLSEVVGLCRGDLDLRQRILTLLRTKGGHRESRCMPNRLAKVLAEYLRQNPLEESEPLFATQYGRRLSPRSVQYRFALWLQRARIEKRLTVHSLRHGFGALLYQATKDLVLVSRALGHRDIKSTQRYAHLDDRALVRAIDRMW